MDLVTQREQDYRALDTANKTNLHRLFTMRATEAALLASSKTAHHQATAPIKGSQKHRQIGAGTCGTVFSDPGTSRVLKLSLNSGNDWLWNDYQMHQRVLRTFAKYQRVRDVHIPRCYWFADECDSQFWHANVRRFPEGYQAEDVLCTEQIPPLPQDLREALIEEYCAPALIEDAKNTPGNRDCLARLYLGKRRRSERPTRFFSLRNFNLHSDQMEALGLDVAGYARSMARALAVLHWDARIDAKDVEFVLGGLPADGVGQTTAGTLPRRFEDRVAQVWLLDFNQCERMSMDSAGVALAVKAFFLNDPYYPRPCSAALTDQGLWDGFRDAYLQMSAEVIGPDAEDGLRALPVEFVDGVVMGERKRLAAKSV
ncbi:hypothetical protein B0A49_07384 [Cryomyces minteri]|uniref:DUF3669 domain-containing protein n=1 Tax=Cryomyces minteri TaxID=331657 RepID=A0A4U0WPJ6_9PEZI|nr:hypothetical protein B0A49_07384 [Cryomyces minteri]